MPKIGAHVSTAGGLHKCVENAEKIGAQCIQIFGSSPRQWRVVFPNKEEIKKYKARIAASKTGPVYLHSSYLVNLASQDKNTLKKSINNLAQHLKITEMIGADGLIFHVGSGGPSTPKEEAIKQAALSMKKVLKLSPGKAKLIIENTAGGGQKIGPTLKEIKKLRNLVSSKRVGVCIDSAHALEAGIIESYSSENIKFFFDECDRKIGLDNIVALHINDSKTEFNSHHDRHENIGEGFIGIEGFKNLAKEKRIAGKPWILEVPGFDNKGNDRKNIEILKSCFK